MGVALGMHPDVESVLYTAEQLAARTAELAAEIGRELGSAEPHLVCVLRGAVVFGSDLLRALGGGATIDFVACTSYVGSQSSGRVRLLKDLEDPVLGRDVLLVEDIVDSGRTLSFLHELLAVRGAASVRTCAMLDKPTARRVEVPVDFIGFTVPDCFVVGYGLDFDQRYRGLPYLAALRPGIAGVGDG